MSRRIVIFLVSVIILIIVIAVPRTLPIRRIQCKTQYGPCPEYVSLDLIEFEGGSLNMTRMLLSDYLEMQNYVHSYELQYRFPSIIDVQLIENKAEVALTTYEGEIQLYNRNGAYLRLVDQTSLPTVIVLKDQISDREIEFSISLGYELYKLYAVNFLYVTENSIEVQTSEGLKMLLPLEGDLDVLLGSIRLTLSQLNTESQKSRIYTALGKDPETIDYRFVNPILR